ncbi:MAG: hypothetical protein CMI08_11275 [Oceanospirillaceae bacterium]|uniref:hypothetical protein n=1 Tax=unclassified Thalassolituus TaxID=2624967 RepID=UPI000C54346E|nr:MULTISPECIES: hypothetical protein [unclassified Thalassolituus]MAS24462.1 hypothetical protein [Oceanospirillaceae bacterium]MAX99760.1 hypothetical protein [Oceanospirillaceae bacterium]MBL36427.1 hypothetical protein [Oceanospirillaceae bacterium]MBS51427.1 hypothetical protein [Oceanospirillaceae bacterium]
MSTYFRTGHWITLNPAKRAGNYTEPRYTILSWKQALCIIHYFQDIPDIHEVEAFLEEEFDYWFNQPVLRKTHPVFVKYLYYKTHTPYSPNMAMLGDRAMDSYTTYDAMNNDCWHTPLADERALLEQLGVDLYNRSEYKEKFPTPFWIDPDEGRGVVKQHEEEES